MPKKTSKILQIKTQEDLNRLEIQASDKSNSDANYQLAFYLQENYDPKEAIFFYKRAYKAGSIDAIHRLGIIYEYGLGVDLDPKLAISYYKKAAKYNHPKGQFRLARSLQNGLGVKRNISQAIKFYTKAANSGHHKAQYSLGLIYSQKNNHHKALKWFALSTDNGFAPAQNKLGTYYEEGVHLKQIYSNAFELYSLAAAKQDANAQNNLGYLLEKGLGVDKDPIKSVANYRMASNQGHPQAMYRFAKCYQKGFGVKKSYKMAATQYQMALDEGYQDAAQKLARLYHKGMKGLPQDIVKASEFYEKAASFGNINSQIYLDDLYQTNSDKLSLEKLVRLAQLEKDYINKSLLGSFHHRTGNIKEATKLYNLAIQRGCEHSKYKLALLYEESSNTKEYEETIISHIKAAANSGHINAQYHLAKIKEKEGQVDSMIKLYSLASKHGHAQASYNLAKYHDEGKEITKDNKKASALYELAANKGHVESQLNIASRYKGGIGGVRKNINKAAKFYELGAKQGDGESAYQLSKLYKNNLLPVNSIISKEERNTKILFYTNMAVKLNHPKAIYSYACILQNGQIASKDWAKATKLFSIGADLGHINSRYQLAIIQQNGIYAPKDFQESMNNYKLVLNLIRQIIPDYTNNKNYKAALKSCDNLHKIIINQMEAAASNSNQISRVNAFKELFSQTNYPLDLDLEPSRRKKVTIIDLLIRCKVIKIKKSSTNPSINNLDIIRHLDKSLESKEGKSAGLNNENSGVGLRLSQITGKLRGLTFSDYQTPNFRVKKEVTLGATNIHNIHQEISNIIKFKPGQNSSPRRYNELEEDVNLDEETTQKISQ